MKKVNYKTISGNELHELLSLTHELIKKFNIYNHVVLGNPAILKGIKAEREKLIAELDRREEEEQG